MTGVLKCHRCGQNDHIASACQSGVVDAVDRLRRELRDDMNEVRGLFQEMQQRMESQQQLEQERWDYVLSGQYPSSPGSQYMPNVRNSAEVAALRVRSAPRVPAQLQHQRRMKALKRKRAEEEKKNEEEEEEQKKKEGDKEKQDGA
ncbi:hypothetical protein N7532_003961 [Penicillium argentinense]|uniref:CCHC-type domain-containing protein n=1 Tax=Penicillium argentinense TaxID=1131581 RepID=A0A9W9FNY6_9EURO|nr:uncharacterized protein N7532_003961 [Penicillium argentinense]KAJ5103432.1 hypothetical protein N7532_003961 [Penicillium argentinense]